MAQVSSATYLSAIVAYIVLLIVGLVGNAAVLGTNLVDVRRSPGQPRYIRVNMNQIAIGLPCLANVAVGIFAVAWFTYVGIAGSTEHFQPGCLIVAALFVWTSVLYLMGLLAMSVDRVLAVRRHRLRVPGGDGDPRSVHMTTRGVWLTVLGFCLYATTVCIALTASRTFTISMTVLCTIQVDDRLEMHGIPVSQTTAVL